MADEPRSDSPTVPTVDDWHALAAQELKGDPESLVRLVSSLLDVQKRSCR